MDVGGNHYRDPSPHIQMLRVPNLSEIDFFALRTGRLTRLQQTMKHHGIPVCLFYNPGNIRYATGTEVMGVWTATTLTRFAVVPADGAPVPVSYTHLPLPTIYSV